MTAAHRLLLAAALCIVSLGLGWSANDSEGSLQPTFVPGMCVTDYDGYLSCTGGSIGWNYTTTFGHTTQGYADDARVVLVPAAAALAWASRRRTPARERVVRVAAVALGAIALRAGVEGQATGALVGAVTTALAASVLRPPSRSGPGEAGSAPAPVPPTGHRGPVAPAGF